MNENNWGMDAHFNLFGTRLHTNKPILILWISIVFILGRNRFYYSKTDCIRAPLNFTGHLRFWLQKNVAQNWRELFTEKKSSPLLFFKNKTNKKTSTITKKNSNFDYETGNQTRIDLLHSWICNLHFFNQNCCKAKYYS